MKELKFTELVNNVWEKDRIKELGTRKYEVKDVLQLAFSEIIEGLERDGFVKMEGFGTIELRRRKGGKHMDYTSGRILEHPDYYKIVLKPSKAMKTAIENRREAKL